MRGLLTLVANADLIDAFEGGRDEDIIMLLDMWLCDWLRRKSNCPCCGGDE